MSKKRGFTFVKLPAARKGFTLVELLVVIGIIAVLISILLPALGNAREQAMGIKCLANMKQMVAATIQYAQENRGMMAPASYTYSNLTWEDQTYASIVVPWYGGPLVGKYVGNRNVCGTAASPARQLPSTDVVYCPVVRISPRHALDVGIGYNNSRQNTMNRKNEGNQDLPRKLGSFNNITRLIVLVDTASNGALGGKWLSGSGSSSNTFDRYFSGQSTWPLTGNDNYTTGYVAYRHRNAANVAFADGHAEAYKNNTSSNGTLWTEYQAGNVTHKAGR